MKSPELLLINLNRVVRELRGAITYLEDDDLTAQMDSVIRRLFLAELLATEQVIAIGGSQGAGKTTLVRLMYDLHKTEESPEKGWLPANAGRGESMSVLVLEDDSVDKAQGYLRVLKEHPNLPGHFRIVEHQATSEAEFREACCGNLQGVMLAVLKVPRRFCRHNGQGFMLMPGYEPVHEENQSWQTLMRQALVACSGRVIVTDEIRLANASQLAIQRDLHASHLAGTDSLVIVTKTEDYADAPLKLQELRLSAAEAFDIAPERREALILCTGSSESSVELWRPQLIQALATVRESTAVSRERQLQQLEQLLSHDLNYTLAGIRSKFALHAAAEQSIGYQNIQEALEVFDLARDSLREEYKRGLRESLKRHHDGAAASMDDLLMKNHEGVFNKLTGIFDTVTEKHVSLAGDIKRAWAKPGNYLDSHINELGKLTSSKLGAPQAFIDHLKPDDHTSNKVARLGYSDEQNQPTEWSKVTPDTLKNLAVVFYPDRDDEGLAGKFNKEMFRSLKLLPAMTLEFARIGSLFPEVFGINSNSLQPFDGGDGVAAAERIQNDFSALQKVGSNVVKGIALMLAVDVAADGHIDTIPALFDALGIGAGTAGMSMAGAATGMVAIGMLTYSVLKEVDRQDRHTRNHALSVLSQFKEHYQAHYLEQFDVLMDQVRARIRDSLTVRYRLDEVLMRRDRIAKALADVTSLRLDLQDEIGARARPLLA